MAIKEIATIGEIQVRDNQSVFIVLNDVSNKLKLDIRLWYIHDESGEWRPTQKGVSLPADKETFGKLKELLAAAEKHEAVKEQGKTPPVAAKPRPVKK